MVHVDSRLSMVKEVVSQGWNKHNKLNKDQEEENISKDIREEPAEKKRKRQQNTRKPCRWCKTADDAKNCVYNPSAQEEADLIRFACYLSRLNSASPSWRASHAA